MKTDRTEMTDGARPSVNVTPLIDILLVLLIIFMVLTPLRPARFKALVPGRRTNTKTSRSARSRSSPRSAKALACR